MAGLLEPKVQFVAMTRGAPFFSPPFAALLLDVVRNIEDLSKRETEQ